VHRVEPAAARQVDVEQQHVGRRLAAGTQRAHQRPQLAVVAGLAHHLDVGRIGQRVANAAPDQCVVVAEDDADH
jgi:hypothetical protein